MTGAGWYVIDTPKPVPKTGFVLFDGPKQAKSDTYFVLLCSPDGTKWAQVKG